MAYLKIFPIKVTDKKALDYITNPDKTDEKLLVSSFGCSPETADLEFSMTREMAKKNGMDKGDNLAFHLIQSFKPGEVDAETAHRLGQQFADEVLKGKYEYVISTHVDKNHIHNHIIFNAASFVDHHKYISNKRSYHKICRISNRICHENGLATSMPTGEKGKSYKENMEYHRGTSWKAKLRVAVDKAIWTSINYEEFLQKMQLAGYEIRQGKLLSFRAPEQQNFTYMKYVSPFDRSAKPPRQCSGGKFISNFHNRHHQRYKTVFHHQKWIFPSKPDTPHFHCITDCLVFFADRREKAKNNRQRDDDFLCQVHTFHRTDKLTD